MAAALEIELTDACMPVETAGRRIVFAYVPEAKAIGRVDGGHAVIAPAAVGVAVAVAVAVAVGVGVGVGVAPAAQKISIEAIGTPVLS